MPIPTEPIGSIPRPPELIAAVATGGPDALTQALYEEAVRDTIERFEATGSPVITDGEQVKVHNFWDYSVTGLPNTAPDGFRIPFAAGHMRRMPRLTSGPFRYRRYADAFLEVAQRYASVPLKQAIISPSALSLMYPPDGLPDYPREAFIDDRGPARAEDRSVRPPAEQLHRPEQPRARAVLGRGLRAHRRPHLPRRRPRLDP